MWHWAEIKSRLLWNPQLRRTWTIQVDKKISFVSFWLIFFWYICTSNFHTMESIQTKFGNRNLVRMLFLIINHSNLNWQQILHSKLEKNETKYSEQERHSVQISISKNGVYSSTNRTHPSSYKPPRPFSSFGPRRFFSSDRVRTQLCRWKLRVHPILVVAK